MADRDAPDPAAPADVADPDAPPAPGGDPRTDSPADRAVASGGHEDEGNNPATWIACGSVVLASLVGAFAVVFVNWWLAAAAVAVAVLGLVTGGVMARNSREDADPDPHTGKDGAPSPAPAAVVEVGRS